MKHNNDFRYDLKVGQVGEKNLADILENKKIEVKTDLQAHRTGNVFVEYESRGKLSGISTSEAEYYCFIIKKGTMIIIDIQELKNKCARYYFNPKRNTVGGDSDTSRGILLPIEELIKEGWRTV